MLRNEDEDPWPLAVEAGTTVIPFDGGEPRPGLRPLAAEVPINLVYGGIPFAVMMATPSDLEDFAMGFSLTEGIIRRAADIRSIRCVREERGLLLEIDLIPERLHGHLARRRALAGRTGCGVCGIDDLESLPSANPPAGPAPALGVGAIRRALDALDRRQPLNGRTGAVHAAAWAREDGELAFVREDVGRHNALDKLIGALCRDGVPPDDGFVVLTSRCSFELVEKAAAFGARSVVAISAPTSLALERARRHDIALVGIARRDTMTVFHGVERIVREDALA